MKPWLNSWEESQPIPIETLLGQRLASTSPWPDLQDEPIKEDENEDQKLLHEVDEEVVTTDDIAMAVAARAAKKKARRAKQKKKAGQPKVIKGQPTDPTTEQTEVEEIVKVDPSSLANQTIISQASLTPSAGIDRPESAPGCSHGTTLVQNRQGSGDPRDIDLDRDQPSLSIWTDFSSQQITLDSRQAIKGHPRSTVGSTTLPVTYTIYMDYPFEPEITVSVGGVTWPVDHHVTNRLGEVREMLQNLLTRPERIQDQLQGTFQGWVATVDHHFTNRLGEVRGMLQNLLTHQEMLQDQLQGTSRGQDLSPRPDLRVRIKIGVKNSVWIQTDLVGQIRAERPEQTQPYQGLCGTQETWDLQLILTSSEPGILVPCPPSILTSVMPGESASTESRT